ncbi:helix-turn-helix domain-containing protein [Streptomyces milbemycinicus]|uniref:helix-turn-helix domain-containing protein n=1 Tax=Streptomyces milbemycinicus TaxID=476552 RepID=UPI0033EB4832
MTSTAFSRERRRAQDRSPTPEARGLLLRSTALFDSRDETEILHRAMALVGAVGPGRAEAGYLMVGGALTRHHATDGADGHPAAALDDRVRELAGRDGPVRLSGRAWGWAYALREPGGLRGQLVVSAGTLPSEDDRSWLTVLARQTAAALSGAAAHRRERERAAELRRARAEQQADRERLESVRSELEHERRILDTLHRAAVHGDGEAGIAEALHKITGLAAGIEDRFGHPRAWAGPGRPDPYPTPDPARHEELLRDTARGGHPVRVRDRLLAVAAPRGEVLGALFLVGPEAWADARALLALRHATVSLALELAHQRTLAEVELRLRRDLVEDLLTGSDDTSAYARAQALGHDLHGPHHVVVVRWAERAADDSFVQAVDKSAAALGMRSLPARRSGTVVLVTDGRPPGRELYAALSREAGTGSGAIGVGGRCDSPGEIPRSYREALRALEVRRRSPTAYGTTFFEDLGLYRILRAGNDYQEIEGFVREWLGPLLDYDSAHRTALVATLSRYFDCGGNYSRTAAALVVHRSTLRYRLQRIREISGSDLTNAETRLNLQVATRVWKIMRTGPD